jgi:hypothetical protein
MSDGRQSPRARHLSIPKEPSRYNSRVGGTATWPAWTADPARPVATDAEPG